MNGLETELVGELAVVRVNIYTEAGRELTEVYGARTTPTFIYFDAAGDEQWRVIGPVDPDQVRAAVAEEG